MNRSISSKTASVLTIAALSSGSLLGVTAGTAQAAGLAGTKCTMSGEVKTVAGKNHVCKADSAGRLVWGNGLTPQPTTLSVSDSWIKATAGSASKMTGAFGEIRNTGSASVTIIAARSPQAKAVQLHQMVMVDGQMVMQETASGFVVEPGASLSLKPGGNHLMFMGLKKTIRPGAMIPVTLITSTGGTVKTKVMAKVFNGANEEYPHGSASAKAGA